ncbi:HlyC/CorC family transporter [Mycetocola tolaasinivorans]|uniref:HlyC/CorC family transporter n=1 Tax=Mycetocola tolaasinivorans TaxID=76635 RepID=A0A3L7AB37_9MICO|nr:hemolysin family protein [Mycetocola tolaasinivorans]RLP76881.1 HlyC/CorC family transporter [Mycetocola tolaasinivorans]
MSELLTALVALLLVAFAALMAAGDAAISVKSRSDILELAENARSARSLRAIAADPGAHLNALAFIRIMAESTAAVLITLEISARLDNFWLALAISALMMTVVSFILVGASPRTVGRLHADGLLRFSAPLLHAVRVLLGPLANALVHLGNRVTPGTSRAVTFNNEEQLLSMVDEATELDVLEEDDRELIHSIFEFNDTIAREIMVPRTDMITIEAETSVNAAMSLFLSTGVSRIPVIDGSADVIVGVLYLRDIARITHEREDAARELAVRDHARPASFVPDSAKADDLLRRMQLESNHLALVVDEYGGIAGLVTLEDIIEELVGDISDEYDSESDEIEEISPGLFRVSARLPVDELGEIFDQELEDEDVDTVGGLIAKALGRLPEVGSVARVAGLSLTAERTEGRRGRVTTVLVSRVSADTPAEGGPADSVPTHSDGPGSDS